MCMRILILILMRVSRGATVMSFHGISRIRAMDERERWGWRWNQL